MTFVKKEPESSSEDAAEPGEESPFPPEMQAQRGHKAKTHRGRRSKGKGPRQLHTEAKAHAARAQSAPTPAAALPHLFAAVRSMHAAREAQQITDAEPSGL